MPTRAGSGSSSNAETVAAAAAAARDALRPLDGLEPSFGVVFASPKHDLHAALEATRKEVPGAAVIGCTTAGEITENGLIKGGLATMLVGSDEMLVDSATAQGVKADPRAAAARLCERYAAVAHRGAARGLRSSTTVALVDGLNGAGERLVAEILGATAPLQQVVGGAAGDDGAFKATYVGRNGDSAVDSAAVLHAFGPRPWGVGVDHGLRPRTGKMLVTRAEGNVVREIEHRPAFAVYEAHAARSGVTLTPENTGRYLIGNELGIFFFDEMRKARAPLAVGDDGSLTCAAEIPQGASVCILDGEADSMVEAAGRAAQEALRNLKGGQAAGVLLFDCVCRGMILDAQFQREVDAVRGVFPDVPVAGLLTYGEIARFKGRLDGWHNTTAVVVAIPA